MRRGLALSLVITALLTSAAFAGIRVTTDSTTTEAIAFPIGARAIGMGGAFTAVSDDATAPFWNPAGLSRVPHFQTTLELGADVSEFDVDQDDIETVIDALSGDIDSPSEYGDLQDIVREFGQEPKELRVGTGVSFALHNLAISAIGDGEGNVTLLQPGGPLTPISVDGAAVALVGPAISAARVIKGDTAVGITVHALRAKGWGAAYVVNSAGVMIGEAADADDDNVAVDIGVLTTTEDGLSVGAVLRNVNSPEFDLNLPTVPLTMQAQLDWSLDLGIAARRDNLLVAWDMANIGKTGGVQVNMGLEYKPVKYIALRAGLMGGDYTLGAGLHLGLLGLEFASGERIKSMAAAGLRTQW